MQCRCWLCKDILLFYSVDPRQKVRTTDKWKSIDWRPTTRYLPLTTSIIVKIEWSRDKWNRLRVCASRLLFSIISFHHSSHLRHLSSSLGPKRCKFDTLGSFNKLQTFFFFFSFSDGVTQHSNLYYYIHFVRDTINLLYTYLCVCPNWGSCIT